MSASICWRRTNPAPDRLRALAPSKFMEQMERAGISVPCQLGEGHRDILRGLAAAWGDRDDNNPYTELMAVIDKHGPVELWAEY